MESDFENTSCRRTLSILIDKLYEKVLLSNSRVAFKDSLLPNVGDDDHPFYIEQDYLKEDTNKVSIYLDEKIQILELVFDRKKREIDNFFIDKKYKDKDKNEISICIEKQINSFLYQNFPSTETLEIEESFMPVSNNSIISYSTISLLDKSKFYEYIGKLDTFCTNFHNMKPAFPYYIHMESSYISNYSIAEAESKLNSIAYTGYIENPEKYMPNINLLGDIHLTSKVFFVNYIEKNFEYSKKNGTLSVIINFLKEKLDYCKKLSIYNIKFESINNLTEEDIFNEIVKIHGSTFAFHLVHENGALKCYDSEHRSLKYRIYKEYIQDISHKYLLQIMNEYNKNKYEKIVFNIDNFFQDLDHEVKKSLKLASFPIKGTSLSKAFQENIDIIRNETDQMMLGNADKNISFSNVEVIRNIFKLDLLERQKDDLYDVWGYNDKVKYIDNEINLNNANKLLKKYNLDSIPENLLERFIEMYKKITIKELQEGEKFFQGKTDSIKIFDKIKYKGTPINNLSINLEGFEDNTSNSFTTRIFPVDETNSLYVGNHIEKTFYLYILAFEEIFLHLSLFKDEFYKLLEITDLNKLKDYIINIINFGLPNENLDKMEDMKSYYRSTDSDEYFKEKANLILRTIDSDEKKKTKNEKFNLYYQALKLLHNNQKSENFVEYIINSGYLKKLNSAAITDIFESIGRILQVNDFNNSLETIRKEKPKLLPGYIYTDFIKNIINDIIKNKINNHEELDKIFEKLLLTNPSENIRKLKYVSSLVANYEAISKWIDLAKEKEKDVFAPSFSTESFRFRVLEDFDPYHFQVGMDTNCCQTIGGLGQSAAIDSFINPKAGVVVLEVNKDGLWNLAAQSYFHVFEMNNAGKKIKGIILDNIEAGNFGSRYGKDRFYPKAYAILGRYLKNKGFDIVGCGEQFTRVMSKNDFMLSSIDSDPRHFEVEENNLERYTDFNHKSFYDLLKPMFNFEMTNDIDLEVKTAKYNDILLKLSRFLSNTSLERESIKVYNLIY